MMKKLIGIFICVLTLVASIGPILFTTDQNVQATTSSGGKVGLDYDTIYENLETLSYIVFNDSIALQENGIHKGRDFGTYGDRWAADKIKDWMEEYSTNLTNPIIEQEPIGFFYNLSDNFHPKKIDIIDFNLQLKQGTDDPITISTNESFPVAPRNFIKNFLNITHSSSGGFINVTHYTGDDESSYPLDEYDFLSFNVTYTKIQDANNFTDMGLCDELVYVENYSNASAIDIEGRIHLLNISDNELNETLNLITEANATGYILIRDDVSNLQGWELPLPGVAVSEENGSLIKSYIQNESYINVSSMTPSVPFPVQGNLEIFYYNSSALGQNKTIFLVNEDLLTNISSHLIKRLYNPKYIGVIVYSTTGDSRTHTALVPNVFDAKFFWNFCNGNKIGMKSQMNCFSSKYFFPLPTFYINRTIYVENGVEKKIDDADLVKNWSASFTLDWDRNYNVSSYNVYCTIQGKDQSKTVIISGGHYDGFWGQMSTDDASGVAVMLGILKYMNDNHITPKYNILFITFSGEEYIAKGSRGYVLRHWYDITPDNIECMINLDVLAHNTTDSNLYIQSYARLNGIINLIKIIRNYNIVTKIAEWTDYQQRNNDTYSLVTSKAWIRPLFKDILSGTIENTIPCTDGLPFWLRDIPIINFGKEEYEPTRHKTGTNHTQGDVMTHINKTDLEVTTDLVWNISKYYCIDPDCWFENITYQPWDNSTDINEDNDSVNVTFTIKTSLPQDRVWVKATLISQEYPILCRYKTQQHYVVTPSGIQDTLTIKLPLRAPQGNYILQVFLYNSTGIVDRDLITLFDYLDFGIYANEIYTPTETLPLYPPNDPPATPLKPWGDISIVNRDLFPYTTNTTDPNGDTIWYQWKWSTSLGIDYYTRWFTGGPYDSGENCTQYIGWLFPGDYQVHVRAKDNFWNPNVVTGWSEALDVTVSQAGSGASPFNNMLLGQFTSTTVALNQQAGCNGLGTGVNLVENQKGSLNWTWDFGDGNISYEQDVTHAYSQPGNYTVNLTIVNNLGGVYNCTTTISVLVLRADFITSGSAQPNQTVIFTDTSIGVYSIVNWSWDFDDGDFSYNQHPTHVYENTGEYNVTLSVKDAQNNTHTYSSLIFVESLAPDFISVIDEPDPIGFGNNITISVDFFDNQSGVKSVMVNITYPDNTTGNFTMEQNVSSEHDYLYVFNDSWQTGVYNYSIWLVDYANNMNCTSGYNFTVSADATITVCTTKDTYTGNEYINLTDPPGSPSPSLGYELLDDGAVLHLWNQYDNYYFNTSSGIQLTNHKDDYWSHNVMMLGYYNNDQWNLLFRTDELTGFSRSIETDAITYVNITLWKDLTYGGYQFRLALRCHLGVNDHDLTVIPYIKNIGANAIPYVLGFGWELKDIQINRTTEGDYIVVDGESYFLNQTLENVYTDLDETVFYLMDDSTETQTQSLYVRWDPDLTYKLQVESRAGQQNAPVTLFIRIGTLTVGQQKSTSLHWCDAGQETYYFDSYVGDEAWESYPENMVDGSTESFAYTNVDDLQFCKSNTCPGDDLGMIQKVELRAHCYREGEGETEINITLQPVLEEKSGQNYTAAPGSEADWTQWFDITSDFNHGSGEFSTPWIWGEIQSLTCNVISSITEGILYCSKVEVRVTYNTAPSVSNPSPLHGTNGVSLQPWLNITVSDPDEDTMNVTWYTNSTTSLLTLRPNANGSITELSKYPSSSPANYVCVDETVANDSDYVYWYGTTWKKDSYNLANHGNATGVIHSVTAYARCARIGSIQYPKTNGSAKIVIRANGSYSYGSEFKPPYSAMEPYTYTTYTYTWMINPVSGKSWTWTDIDNLQTGIAFIGNEGTSRCTHLYIVVNYTNPNLWYQFGQNSSVGDGVYHQQLLYASVNGQWWYWKVKADDGTSSTWSSVYKFYTGYKSKIENTGETNISGYLLMQVQYYDELSEEWMLDVEVVNQSTRKYVNISEQLGLDQFFNGEVNTEELTHGAGTYRVYAAFCDPEGNILTTDDEVELVSWWEFTKT